MNLSDLGAVNALAAEFELAKAPELFVALNRYPGGSLYPMPAVVQEIIAENAGRILEAYRAKFEALGVTVCDRVL